MNDDKIRTMTIMIRQMWDNHIGPFMRETGMAEAVFSDTLDDFHVIIKAGKTGDIWNPFLNITLRKK